MDFWCRSEQNLADVFAAFPTADDAFEYDSENVWEWFEGRTVSGLAFNISRPHGLRNDDEPPVPPDEPIRFTLTHGLAERMVENFGLRLADALDREIHTGEVVYLGGDEFEYRVSATFRPPTEKA